MHDDDAGARLGDRRRHIGIALQAPDIIDDRDARGERAARRLRLIGVDRDRDAALRDERVEQRREPRPLLVRRERRVARPRRFGADVDDVGAVGGELSAPGPAPPAGAKKRPPSEKELGVTLTMPMMTGRVSTSEKNRSRDVSRVVVTLVSKG